MKTRHAILRPLIAVLLLAAVLLLPAAACQRAQPDLSDVPETSASLTVTGRPSEQHAPSPTSASETETETPDPEASAETGSAATALPTSGSVPDATPVPSLTRTPSTVPPTTAPPSPAPTTAAPTTAPTPTPVSTRADDGFDQTVRDLLIRGVADYLFPIDLTAALDGYRLSDAEMEHAINRVHELYREVHNTRPDRFYLSGSASLQYEYRTESGGKVLTAMMLDPAVRSTYAGWSPQQLEAERQRLLNAADAIVSLAAGRADWDAARVAHDELVRRVAYDTSGDQAGNHAAGALLAGSTLCEGYARAYQLILSRLGLPVRLVTGTARSGGTSVPHAWNIVTIGGVPYHVDVTFDDPVPDRGSGAMVLHPNFLRSDAVMRATHSWDAASAPACPQDGAQYYKNAGLTAASRTELETKVTAFYRDSGIATPGQYDLELLYTGSDTPPTDAELAGMLQRAVSAAGYGGYYLYSARLDKGAAVFLLTTR